MDTMQTSGSKPTWSNGTDAVPATTTASSHNSQTVANADDVNGNLKKLKKKDKKARMDQKPDSGIPPQDEATVVKKEKKKQREPAVDSQGHEAESREEHEVNGPNSPETKRKEKERKSSKKAKGGVESLDDAAGLDDDDADPTQLDETRTDSDWLRARTSRVLDLVDVDEIRTKKSEPAVSEDGDSSSISSSHNVGPLMPASDSVVKHDLEESFANGRLFIRNLPYSADGADIRKLFSKYGNVNEVSNGTLLFVH